jgi:hypothetical protein
MTDAAIPSRVQGPCELLTLFAMDALAPEANSKYDI